MFGHATKRWAPARITNVRVELLISGAKQPKLIHPLQTSGIARTERPLTGVRKRCERPIMGRLQADRFGTGGRTAGRPTMVDCRPAASRA